MQSQPTAKSSDRRVDPGKLAHIYCGRCIPQPRLGQTITALCGTAKVYDGSPAGTDECVVCAHLLTVNPFDCGHPSPEADAG